MKIQDTHYLIDSKLGSPTFGCDHDWTSTKESSAGGKNKISRTCNDCGRWELWLSLARHRKPIRF